MSFPLVDPCRGFACPDDPASDILAGKRFLREPTNVHHSRPFGRAIHGAEQHVGLHDVIAPAREGGFLAIVN